MKPLIQAVLKGHFCCPSDTAATNSQWVEVSRLIKALVKAVVKALIKALMKAL